MNHGGKPKRGRFLRHQTFSTRGHVHAGELAPAVPQRREEAFLRDHCDVRERCKGGGDDFFVGGIHHHFDARDTDGFDYRPSSMSSTSRETRGERWSEAMSRLDMQHSQTDSISTISGRDCWEDNSHGVNCAHHQSLEGIFPRPARCDDSSPHRMLSCARTGTSSQRAMHRHRRRELHPKTAGDVTIPTATPRRESKNSDRQSAGLPAARGDRAGGSCSRRRSTAFRGKRLRVVTRPRWDSRFGVAAENEAAAVRWSFNIDLYYVVCASVRRLHREMFDIGATSDVCSQLLHFLTLYLFLR